MDRKNPPSSIDPKGLKEEGTLAAITHLFPLLCWGPVATGKAACASERPRPRSGRCGYSHAEGERQSKEVRETLIEAGEQRGGNRSFCLLLGDDDSLRRRPRHASLHWDRAAAASAGYAFHTRLRKGLKSSIPHWTSKEGRRKRLEEISFEGRGRERERESPRRPAVVASSSISSFSLIFPRRNRGSFGLRSCVDIPSPLLSFIPTIFWTGSLARYYNPFLALPAAAAAVTFFLSAQRTTKALCDARGGREGGREPKVDFHVVAAERERERSGGQSALKSGRNCGK